MTSPARSLWREAVISCGFLGRAPVAPGTFGTLGGVGLAVALGALLPTAWFAPAALLLAATGYVAGWKLAPWCEAFMERKDPGLFVLDELVGYMVAVALFGPAWQPLVAAFVLFRIFDVWKPWPGRRLEALGGGHGILLDDVAAGVYTAAVMAVLGFTDMLSFSGAL